MISTIRKRDGKLVPYDNYKIANAIFKAAEAVGGKDFAVALTLAKNAEQAIGTKFHSNSIPAVEEIQDIVEKVLIEQGHARVAKAYILYREQHRRERNTRDVLLDIVNTMDGYLKQETGASTKIQMSTTRWGGLILHNSGAITANYWLENIYRALFPEAHRNGDLHLHDLSMFSGYCAGWSLRQLITEGLGGVQSKISSRPPQTFIDIDTANG